MHYDLEKDVELCAICVSHEKKGNLALAYKKEDILVARMGRNPWKNFGNTKIHTAI